MYKIRQKFSQSAPSWTSVKPITPKYTNGEVTGKKATGLTFAFVLAFCSCTTSHQLTDAERATLGEYGPAGAAFSSTILDLADAYSFTALVSTDVGPRSKSYKGKWNLRNDTLILNSDPVPKHKNYSMTEQVFPNQPDIVVRVMDLDSTRLLHERRMSEPDPGSPYPNFKAAIAFQEDRPAFVLVSSVYGAHRFPITLSQADCFTTFVQVPEEIPEFMVDLKFLIRDGELCRQLPNGSFVWSGLVRR